MADDGQILYAKRGRTCVLRFEGPIRYTVAHSLNIFLDKLFEHDPPRMVVADLSAAESIDSTGIGMLAKIAKHQRRAGFGNPLLVSSNCEMNEVLSSVCLDDVFEIAVRAPDSASKQPVPQIEPTEPELADTILEAHRALTELSEHNRALFRDVVEGLERELRSA